jgi:hypothetical protein
MRERTKLTLAGITFSVFKASKDHFTLPTPAFCKLLRTGKLSMHMNYYYEHDGNGSNDVTDKDIVMTPERIEGVIKDVSGHGRRPWLLYVDDKNVIYYSPHSNLSYTLRELA